MDQEQFLIGESLPVAVRITNRSGQTLHLGAESDWLTFSVEAREGSIVSQIAEPDVTGEFDLESSKVAVKRVDLAPCFSINEAGRYAILATVRLKAWGTEIASPAKAFNVATGAKIWDQTVGLPKTSGDTQALPETITYTLQKVSARNGQLRLYLRVNDGYGRLLKVTPIAPLVSFGRPEAQVDRVSRLHVLNQSGAYAFTYSVYDPQGGLLIRQSHEIAGTSRPRLGLDETGVVCVTGGQRRITKDDVPAPEAPEPVTLEPAIGAGVPPAPLVPPAPAVQPEKKEAPPAARRRSPQQTNVLHAPKF